MVKERERETKIERERETKIERDRETKNIERDRERWRKR